MSEPPESPSSPTPSRPRADPASRWAPFPLTDSQVASVTGGAPEDEVGTPSGHFYMEMEPADLDIPRAEQALKRVVDRHDALRTVVTASGTQRTLPETGAYTIEVVDLRDLGEARRRTELSALRERLSHESFPAHRWPRFRVVAARLAESRTRLCLSIDPAVTDVRGLRVLMADWWLLYNRPDSEPEPLELTFRDVVMMDSAMRRDPPEDAAAHGEKHTDMLPPAPQLPTNSAVDPHHVSRRSLRLDEPTWSGVKEQARIRGVQPASALLTAFSVVLGAWSASQHFTVNVSVPAVPDLPRLHPGVDELVGPFSGVSPLEVDLRTTSTVSGLAEDLQRQLRHTHDHARAGGSRAHGSPSRHERGWTSAPVVFRSSADGQDAGFASLAAGFGPPVWAISRTPHVCLDHQVYLENGEALLLWDTWDGVVPDSVLDDMFGAYRRLLETLAHEEAWKAPPDLPLPPWQARTLHGVNDTAAPQPDGLLCDRVLARASDPDQAGLPAVITAERTLNYGELGALAVGVARLLSSRGLGRGDLVAVGEPKGWRQIVALFGVLAAGCGYVPVDPALPRVRQRGIIGSSGVRAVLGGPVGLDADVVTVNVDDAAVADPAALRDWRPPSAPEDVAYVLYTSGSTGVPKGVAISHSAVLNTLIAVNERFAVGPGDRVLGLSSTSFDLSVWDTFGVLGAGGALVLPEPDAARDPEPWLELIRSHEVTLWNSVPALLEMLVEYAGDTVAEPLPLRLVLLSGDWIPVGLPSRVRGLIREDAQIVGLGGPTETSVWTNAYVIDDAPANWTSIPYGFPLPNHRLYVLNERLAPTPIGVPGEIYVGGAGLAHGYHRDPERTAESFIVHPVSHERLYRSGDMARFREDGCLEILGRRDLQLKIAGMRIEPGEVEHALLEDPRVENAVVVAERRGDQRNLVGYVTRKHGSAWQAPGSVDSDVTLSRQLRRQLLERLPAHLVPSRITVLGALPLTSRGKVDRVALANRHLPTPTP